MTLLYGSVLLVGSLLAGSWLVLAAIAGSVDGWSHVHPETRWGPIGRSVIAGCIGFGMGGISALYTSWPDVLSIFAGVLGAALMIKAARVFGPTEPS